MKQNNNSGDSAEPILTRKERIASAIAGKTTFEEKRKAILKAKIYSIKSRKVLKRMPYIIVYLQSCDSKQSVDEILIEFNRLEKPKRIKIVKQLCKELVIMDEIQGEKIEDTWYFSKKQSR